MHVSYPNLFDPEIEVNRKTRRALIQYLRGIILYPGKTNCSTIAKNSGVSHDIVYDFFEYHVEEEIIMQSFLNSVILQLPTSSGLWYVNIDETMIDKIFSEKIEAKVKILYLATNELESPKKMIKTYKKRWAIKKVFRTAKQHLSLRDCQARSAAKQAVHIFAVFVAFAFLEIQKIRHHAKNSEQILHKIRRGQHVKLRDQFETFCNLA